MLPTTSSFPFSTKKVLSSFQRTVASSKYSNTSKHQWTTFDNTTYRCLSIIKNTTQNHLLKLPINFWNITHRICIICVMYVNFFIYFFFCKNDMPYNTVLVTSKKIDDIVTTSLLTLRDGNSILPLVSCPSCACFHLTLVDSFE